MFNLQYTLFWLACFAVIVSTGVYESFDEVRVWSSQGSVISRHAVAGLEGRRCSPSEPHPSRSTLH